MSVINNLQLTLKPEHNLICLLKPLDLEGMISV